MSGGRWSAASIVPDRMTKRAFAVLVYERRVADARLASGDELT